MIQGWKACGFATEKIGESLRRLIAVALVVSSVVFVFYTAFAYRRSSPAVQSASDVPIAAGDPSPTNISHIVFGIGGSAATWPRRRGYSELWWRPGETRGHVWLDAAPAGSWPVTCPPYRLSSLDAARFGERAAASRMARIVAEAYGGHVEDGARWFVMGDDDTVFFTENLVAVLGRYDHREMYYIGASSESVEQDVIHSYGMAFGGGGFAVSYPAAAALAAVIDGCLERYANFYGSDQRVQACLSELGVPLTREPGFHQVDLRGDAYGMLAAHPVAPLVSLHHLDYVDPISRPGPTQMDAIRSLTEASRSDPARTLQQTFCYVTEPGFNWTVSVSWGYTVQLYPWVLPPKDLENPLQTFKTWRSYSNGPFTFKTRPLPGPDRPCDRPNFYFLDRVRGRTSSTVSDYSTHDPTEPNYCARPGYSAAKKIKAARVFAPRMDPHVWQRAPRRQCCDASRIGSRGIEVRIRGCRASEVTSPP